MLQSVGGRLTDKYKGDIKDTLVALQSTGQESNRLEAARCLGQLVCCLTDDELVKVLKVKAQWV